MTDRPERSLFERDIMIAAVGASLRKLDPRLMLRNPVMFVVEVGAALTTAIWLWLTVIFGNFAEAIAEGRGKSQA